MTTTMLGRGWESGPPRRSRLRASIGALAALTVLGAACVPPADQREPDRSTASGTPTPSSARAAVPANPAPTIVVPSTAAPRPPGPPATTAPKGPPATAAPEPVSFVAQGPISDIAGCQLFPANHYRNATGIDRLPVHESSDRWMESLGGDDASMRFPRGVAWNGMRTGMPINVVDSREVGFHDVLISWEYAANAFRGQYPIPRNPMIQGHPGVGFDQHVLMVDVADCTAYELIMYNPLAFQLFRVHTARNGTRYPLDDVVRPPNTTNSPNTPMVGQYVMYDDVTAGSVDHVMAWCTRWTGSEHVWPARRSDGTNGPDAVPMGSWIRLSDRVDPDDFDGLARPVVEALRRHGAILTDTCGHDFSLLAENTSRWDDHEVMQLRSLSPTDFEVVDASEMIVDPDTFEIR